MKNEFSFCIGRRCYQTFPCQHDCTMVVNGEEKTICLGGLDILTILQNVGPQCFLSWEGEPRRTEMYEHFRDSSDCLRSSSSSEEDGSMPNPSDVFARVFGPGVYPEENREYTAYVEANPVSEQAIREMARAEEEKAVEDKFNTTLAALRGFVEGPEARLALRAQLLDLFEAWEELVFTGGAHVGLMLSLQEICKLGQETGLLVKSPEGEISVAKAIQRPL